MTQGNSQQDDVAVVPTVFVTVERALQPKSSALNLLSYFRPTHRNSGSIMPCPLTLVLLSCTQSTFGLLDLHPSIASVTAGSCQAYAEHICCNHDDPDAEHFGGVRVFSA